MSLEEVRVWSPTAEHRRALVRRLQECGFETTEADSAVSVMEAALVACAITSSTEPMVRSMSHANICVSNDPRFAGMIPRAVGSFGTIVVDDVQQARVEYGDLVQAA
jgi:ornithine cyclodeaminase/alanine dehydrogenase-like protein (mu-crystallin family)